MRLSRLVTHTSKESSRSEVSLNAQLLTRAGYVSRLMAGVYQFLPLGLRVLTRIENIIREEMNALGGQEILMPTLHPREPWAKTGRWDTLDVLYRLSSEGGVVAPGTACDLALGPTHEEIVTPLVAGFVHSYRDLPTVVYQIQTKFRNEPRPKSGLLRGREFRMKDMYSFHTNQDDLDDFYNRAVVAYRRVYERCGLGDRTLLTYASGGSFSRYSHEFQTLTPYGEDTIYRIPDTELAINREIVGDLDAVRDIIPGYKPGDEKMLQEHKAIEVGNIFKLVTRFSDPFGATYTDRDGERCPIIMGTYGMGPSRLMGAIVECLSDDHGMIWPESVAPYRVGLINLKPGAADVDALGADLEQRLAAIGIETLYDDRTESAGVKFADMDLLGLPWQVIVGPRGLAKGVVEVKKRADGQRQEISVESLLSHFTGG